MNPIKALESLDNLSAAIEAAYADHETGCPRGDRCQTSAIARMGDLEIADEALGRIVALDIENYALLSEVVRRFVRMAAEKEANQKEITKQ